MVTSYEVLRRERGRDCGEAADRDDGSDRHAELPEYRQTSDE
jgi:hypothetical protein